MSHRVMFTDSNQEPILKLLWSTDLHLDAADKAQHLQFFDLVQDYQPDAILIGGDISNGSTSLIHLKQLAKLINKPFYFVLGNHDFYYGSIETIRKLASETAKLQDQLHYLTTEDIIEITPTMALIGHDGWSDGRAGDFFRSDVILNDYFLIDDLKNLSPEERLNKLNKLGSEAADNLSQKLNNALQKYKRVIILTHVPPFKQACLFEGHPCDDNWAPHFIGQATGEALQKISQEYPERQILVLCGHCHHSADVFISPNLHVLTGQSELGIPMVQGLIYVN